jgi:hypothetical protein
MAIVNKIGPNASVGLLTDVDTVQRNALGFRTFDENGGEFIYLRGVASTVIGDWVVFNEVSPTATTWATQRAVHTTHSHGPIAIAMAAVLATQFGWYQIYGNAKGNTVNDTQAANTAVWLTGTAGQVDDDAVATDIVYGAVSQEVGAATLVNFFISYPFALGVQPT